MMRLSLAVVLLLAPAFAQAWPWSDDMANQISIKPQESADLKNRECGHFQNTQFRFPVLHLR